MKQDEIITTLSNIGITTTRQTLARYEEQGLVPQADRNNRGQAGKVADYPPETVIEFIASNRLLSGNYGDEGLRALVGGKIAPAASPKAVAAARGEVIFRDQVATERGVKGLSLQSIRDYDGITVDFETIDSKMGRVFIDFLALAWEFERENARQLLQSKILAG